MKTKINKKTLIEILNSSSNLEEAADFFGISRRTLSRNIDSLKIKNIRSSKSKTINNVNKIKEEQTKDKVIELYSLNKDSIEEIAEQNEVSIKEVKQWIDEYNTIINDTNNDNRFDLKQEKDLKSYKKFVITSIQNDTPINQKFLNSLRFFCKKNNAKLLVCPVFYKYHSKSVFNINTDDLLFKDIQLTNNLKLMAKISVLPTITAPLAGLDTLSKGKSMIIPHPQIEMKTLATLNESPAIMHTTGSISLAKACYPKNKTGNKAEFNHSYGALLVELGSGSSFHLRLLNADDNSGFYDIDGYYQENNFTKINGVEAIYTGDEHVSVMDENVKNAIYMNKDSIVNKLKPKAIIRGDLFDAGSVSHHDNHNYLLRVAKHMFGQNNVTSELMEMAKHLQDTTPKFSQNIIIGSNHNDHLFKWLTTCNPHNDLVNAKTYHFLSYLVLENTVNTKIGPKLPNLIKLWLENYKHNYNITNNLFLGRHDNYQIKGIEISLHGDVAINGGKGSPASFSRLPSKTIVGHSHSPSIKYGCYTVGTSSYLKLGYSSGASSWLQSSCIIYKNGKRQMINIINGKWHA